MSELSKPLRLTYLSMYSPNGRAEEDCCGNNENTGQGENDIILPSLKWREIKHRVKCCSFLWGHANLMKLTLLWEAMDISQSPPRSTRQGKTPCNAGDFQHRFGICLRFYRALPPNGPVHRLTRASLILRQQTPVSSCRKSQLPQASDTHRAHYTYVVMPAQNFA